MGSTGVRVAGISSLPVRDFADLPASGAAESGMTGYVNALTVTPGHRLLGGRPGAGPA